MRTGVFAQEGFGGAAPVRPSIRILVRICTCTVHPPNPIAGNCAVHTLTFFRSRLIRVLLVPRGFFSLPNLSEDPLVCSFPLSHPYVVHLLGAAL